MFCFFKSKCLLFVYLYVVVIAAGLGVSALPRYGKQRCLGRISGESGSTRDAFCTTVWFGYTRPVHNGKVYRRRGATEGGRGGGGGTSVVIRG